MALTKSKSQKCPVCVGCTAAKVVEIDRELAPLLETFKELGEVPKAKDSRFGDVAHKVGISPYSLRYHLKECLLDLEIQDQRLLELKDMSAAIGTAKNVYMGDPTMGNATALATLVNVFRGLAEDIEGQQDPETTVGFLAETVLNPLARQTLAAMAQELRSLRETLLALVPKNHTTYVRAHIDQSVDRVGAALAHALDDSFKNVCGYYKVELEAQARKRALDMGEVSEEVHNAAPDPAPAVIPLKRRSSKS